MLVHLRDLVGGACAQKPHSKVAPSRSGDCGLFLGPRLGSSSETHRCGPELIVGSSRGKKAARLRQTAFRNSGAPKQWPFSNSRMQTGELRVEKLEVESLE